MCGILLLMSANSKENEKVNDFIEKIVEQMQRRGPDYYGKLQDVVDDRVDHDGNNGIQLMNIEMHSSVLHLRGNVMQPQPIRDTLSGNMLAFNGELYGICNDGGNDALFLSNLLADHSKDGEAAFLETIGTLRGEWAFVYYIKKTNCLYFGRDFLGRRSLMMKSSPSTSSFYLSSVSDGPTLTVNGDEDWKELECTGLYKLDLKKLHLHVRENPGQALHVSMLLLFLYPNPFYPNQIAKHVEHLPWITSIPHPILSQAIEARMTVGTISESEIPSTTNGQDAIDLSSLPITLIKAQSDAKSTLFRILSESVHQRVFSIPSLPHGTVAPSEVIPQPARLAVLFSGGLDCMILAALASSHLEADEPIDLLNVAFENPRTLKAKKEGKHGDSKPIKIKSDKKISKKRKDLLKNLDSVIDVVAQDLPPFVADGSKLGDDKNDDVNEDRNDNATDDLYDTPDRKTAILGHIELCRLYPSRRWRLVLINVTHKEATGRQQQDSSNDTQSFHHQDHILKLMHPLCTVMDLSIAMAFYFASRGRGEAVLVNGQLEKVPGSQTDSDGIARVDTSYNSTARVLLSGLGADEQLGGYSRHRAAFEKRGWQGLQEEIQLDCARIGQRNLGRDDRIISSHGKEVRFPYLDENVYVFLQSLPVYVKTDPRWNRSVGDKLLLRLVAAQELGLHRAGIEAKRAVQFGARTAKMELGTRSTRGHFTI